MKNLLKTMIVLWRSVMQRPMRLFVLPREVMMYFSDWRKFKKGLESGGGGVRFEMQPVFFQRAIPSSFDAHYVYQAAWAIKRVVSQKPSVHHDISSNIPYVAALSAVVPVKFCEYRPPNIKLPGLTTQHVDLASLPFESDSVKSLSCLHVLEHVGLGRYGDPVSALAFGEACREIGRVTAPGGSVFLSIPVGRARVCFNMHRVSDPAQLPLLMGEDFRLKEFSVVTDDNQFLENVDPSRYASQRYACGLYWFEKI